ncbi:uncharacterized protein LOC115688662 [Syzygium oleosum]|uniref:uncharacterized protein LOC115688662 n=1 Tax=Syzygium oleosum TaxID=219896 RepID=UPI0024BB4F07|nr:uncharacterized protein LOC115688662 [Syzygium oleosum]
MEGRSAPSLKRPDLPKYTSKKEKKTYREVFVKHRNGLLKEAGQWMKNTTSFCSLVPTIIMVVYVAAFTIFGGTNSSTKILILLKNGTFTVFAVAYTFALFSSIIATLMFLAILTSCYAIDDFLCSLWRKMIVGLTFLFLSLAFMLIVFGSALTMVLSEPLKWIYILITFLAASLVILFAIPLLPLCVEMLESTYRPLLYRPL